MPAKAQILIADDDKDFARLLRSVLEMNGYATNAVHHGSMVLDTLDMTEPDLIVLDMMMPGHDGLAVLRALRANPKTEHTPVLMISGTLDESAVWDGLLNGCDVFLRKPFDTMEFVSVVKRLLARVPAAA